jgi:acyl-coenzyme A synthetase/AMP-(fatty) acid ligase
MTSSTILLPSALAAQVVLKQSEHDGCAVHANGESWSQASLMQAADRIRCALAPHVPAQGGVVVVALSNPAHFVSAVLGVWSANCAVALGSATFGRADIDAMRMHLQPAVALVDDVHADGWRGPSTVETEEDLVLSSGTACRVIPFETFQRRENLAVVKFSSGTTGVPKMVAINGAQIMAAVQIVTSGLELTSRDTVWCPVPVHHSYGFDLGVLPLLYTGTRLVAERAAIPRRFWTDAARFEASVVLGVPSLYRAILRSGVARPLESAPPRWLISCTAPLPDYTARAFRERNGVSLCQHYGSSETGAVAIQAATMDDPSAGSVGNAMPGVTIQILDHDGNAVAEGVVGRVSVQSAGVASGYLSGAPTGPSPFLPNGGRFLMGDRGRLLGGELCLEGRVDDLINIGGLKVSPAEVIAVLEAHPEVDEAAVTGLVDSDGEQSMYAMVASTSTSLTESALIDWCRTALADFKIPRRVDIRAALPRAHSGKVRLTLDPISKTLS